MKRKIKIMTMVLAALAVVIIALAAVLIIGKNRYDGLQEENEALSAEIQGNKQTVYVALSDIGRGEELVSTTTADEEHPANVAQQERYIDLSTDNYITADDLGSQAVIDIKKDVPIMKDMVTALETAEDTREYEIPVASLMTDQAENDIVDVRIMFPNGIDQVVLSKKQVKNLNLGNCVFYTYMSAEEIDRMASAIIDAFTISGTKIYTVRYVESNIQPEAIPTYVVRSEVIDHIMDDPNVLETAKQTLNAYARLDLEAKLGNLTEDQLAAVAEGHGLSDTAKSSVLAENANSIVLDDSNGWTDGSEETESGEETEDGEAEDSSEMLDGNGDGEE